MARTYDQLNELMLAEGVALETLRLKPATPSLFMQANEDTQVANLKVKKGMTIMMANKVAHTKEENSSNPEEFIPERWIKNACPHLSNHDNTALKAFGGGPRFCPGRTLALDEMKMAISMLCKNFTIELVGKVGDVEEYYSFTMRPKGLFVRLN